MKKKHMKTAVIVGILLAGMTEGQAQQVADFENLNLETDFYYDGGADHSGTEMETEEFYYQSQGVHFSVNHTDWGGGSSSFGGMAYSNQTDTATASFTNFSAYANPEISSTYGIYYPSWGVSDSIFFDEAANLQSVKIANHAWAYHYMKGTDGSGSGIFTEGDSLTVVFRGYNVENELVGTIQIHLADFTDGNAFILDDWTEIDLSALVNVSYVKMQISSNDAWAPTYVCMDDLSYSTTNGIEDIESEISVYPNPVTDFLKIDNAEGGKYQVCNSCGRVLEVGNINANSEWISTADFAAGMYFIRIDFQSHQIVKKIIK